MRGSTVDRLDQRTTAGAGAINEAYSAFLVSGCERNTISADLAGVSIRGISEQTQALLKVCLYVIAEFEALPDTARFLTASF